MDTKENKEERAARAMEEVEQEEIRADRSANPAPNAFWGQKGTWWILIVVFALVLFLFLWMFLA